MNPFLDLPTRGMIAIVALGVIDEGLLEDGEHEALLGHQRRVHAQLREELRRRRRERLELELGPDLLGLRAPSLRRLQRRECVERHAVTSPARTVPFVDSFVNLHFTLNPGLPGGAVRLSRPVAVLTLSEEQRSTFWWSPCPPRNYAGSGPARHDASGRLDTLSD
jgi:hypothetical protein